MDSQPEINPEPIAPTPDTPPKSKLWPNILFGVLCLLALTVAGYLYYQNQTYKIQLTQVPTPLIAPSVTPGKMTGPTTDWQTYSNTALGYSLQYPTNVNIANEMNDQYNRFTSFKGGNLNFEVSLKKTPSNFDLSKYFFMDNPIKTTTTLAGQLANLYELPSGYCDGPSCSDPYLAVVTEKNGNMYTLIFNGDTELSDIENQILSTFQFNSTSNLTLTDFKAECIKLRNSTKSYDETYHECVDGSWDPVSTEKLRLLCEKYRGSYNPQADTCRHAPPGGPCGPEAIAVCTYQKVE